MPQKACGVYSKIVDRVKRIDHEKKKKVDHLSYVSRRGKSTDMSSIGSTYFKDFSPHKTASFKIPKLKNNLKMIVPGQQALMPIVSEQIEL